MLLQIFRGGAGAAILIAIAALFSRDRKAIRWKPVGYGLALNFLFAFLVLRTAPGRALFELISRGLLKILQFAAEGIKFVFGPLYTGFTQVAGFSGWPYAFVLHALVPIVFFAALINLLYYIGLMQKMVEGMARVFKRLFDLSSVEALVTASNVFLGQTQAPLVIAPYLNRMTDSQLFLTMVGGMSTVGSGMVIVYAGMGAKTEYVLAASIMAAPAAVVFSKILVPGATGEGATKSEEHSMGREAFGVNSLDAVGRGALEGWKAVVGVSVMLLAFISLIHMMDWAIGAISLQKLDLEMVLGWLFAPAAYIVGVPAQDAISFAQLVGAKTAFNEVIAFGELRNTPLSPKGFMLACFAMTGFANLSSIAIQIGCLGELAPSCRGRVAQLGIRAVLAATLANLLSATIAGILFAG